MTEDAETLASHRWTGTLFDTVEDVTLARRGERWVLGGTVTGTGNGTRITYEVVANASWETEFATFDAVVDGTRTTGRLERAGDTWALDGRVVDGVTGCRDVDFAWTPATNTLPIRRLADAEIGEPVQLSAAWVRMPELDVARLDQSYTRTGPATWIFRSPDFEAELIVDEFGLVTRYGVDGLWVSEPGR